MQMAALLRGKRKEMQKQLQAVQGDMERVRCALSLGVCKVFIFMTGILRNSPWLHPLPRRLYSSVFHLWP